MRFSKVVLLVCMMGMFTSTVYAEDMPPPPPPGMGPGMGNGMGPGSGMGKPANKAGKFGRKLMHANFMPNLMPRLMRSYNRGGNPLGLSKEQFDKLQGFHKKNVSKMQGMVRQVMQLEKQARDLALAGKSDEEVLKVGKESLKVRSKIMHGKLKCRAFVRSVLTPEQFKTLTENYYRRPGQGAGMKPRPGMSS